MGRVLLLAVMLLLFFVFSIRTGFIPSGKDGGLADSLYDIIKPPVAAKKYKKEKKRVTKRQRRRVNKVSHGERYYHSGKVKRRLDI